MACQNKIAVVTGGSGIIGSGIIRALLERNASVVAPVRNAKGAARLEAVVAGVPTDKLQVLEADVGTEAGVELLAQEISAKYGTIDYIVTSIGSWWQKGPLLEQPLSEVTQQILNLAVAHWLVAKALVPLLKDSPESGYIIISGTAGEQLVMPETGLVTVGASTLFGISTVLREELRGKAFRLNEVRLSVAVQRHGDANKSGGMPYSHRTFADIILRTLQDKSKKSEVVRIGGADLEGAAA
jgi:3-oxoacyl-[acyl-carrier protein] reductase